MCKNHKHAESIQILRKAHYNHTYECCPDIDSLVFAEKVPALEQLTGKFPVYNNGMEELLRQFRSDFVSYDMELNVRDEIRDILRHITPEEFTKNTIRKDFFEVLKEAIEKQEQEPTASNNYKKFELIKKSSPKLSNLLMSLLKYAGIEDYQNHELMKKFNDRGTTKMDGYEMVISTEPHRIVGMSAFGKFTSCQDWIEKDEDAEYHSYTHQSWANAMDETVGIMYIRKVDADEPTEDYTNVQDMVSRSLVRVLKLENGQIVVFLHRIYAKAPYDKYLIDTIEEWEKTLSDNIHVVHMYKDNRSNFEQLTKNKYGVDFSGTEQILFKQSECVAYGGSRKRCDECNGGSYECDECNESGEVWRSEDVDCPECYGTGWEDEDEEIGCDHCDGTGCVIDEGYETCDNCDGDGHITCDNCDGEGYFDNDSEEYHPYNDHTDWIDFRYNGIQFYVPNYILHWETTQEEWQAEINRKYANFKHKPGDKVQVKWTLRTNKNYKMESGSGYSGDISTVRNMVEKAGQTVTIASITENGLYRIAEDNGSCNWVDEMFQPVGTPKEEIIIAGEFKAGDKVTISDPYLVGTLVDGLRIWESMKQVGTVLPIDSQQNYLYIQYADTDLWVPISILVLVERNENQGAA